MKIRTKKVKASNGQIVTLNNDDLNLVASGHGYTEQEVADMKLENERVIDEIESEVDDFENSFIGDPE